MWNPFNLFKPKRKTHLYTCQICGRTDKTSSHRVICDRKECKKTRARALYKANKLIIEGISHASSPPEGRGDASASLPPPSQTLPGQIPFEAVLGTDPRD
jgi:hypothetical protein